MRSVPNFFSVHNNYAERILQTFNLIYYALYDTIKSFYHYIHSRLKHTDRILSTSADENEFQ